MSSATSVAFLFVINDWRANVLKNIEHKIRMNKYYQILNKILNTGKTQTNRKGRIRYLLNERLTLVPGDLLDIFESHGIARRKLKAELSLVHAG